MQAKKNIYSMRIAPKPRLAPEQIAENLKRKAAIYFVCAGTFFFFFKIVFF